MHGGAGQSVRSQRDRAPALRLPGPGDVPCCPRGCHRTALALPAVAVGRERNGGEKSSLRPGQRKDLFPCRGNTGYFSREKTRVNVVLGAFQYPRGLKKAHTEFPRTRLKTAGGGGGLGPAAARGPQPLAPSRAQPGPFLLGIKVPRALLRSAPGVIYYYYYYLRNESPSRSPRSQWWSGETCQHRFRDKM